MKKVVSVVFAMVLLLGIVLPAQAEFNPLGFFTFFFSFFSSRPERVVSANGSFVVRITVPSQKRAELEGLEYIWARPLAREGEAHNGTPLILVPRGWQAVAMFGMPTQAEEPDWAKYRVNNVVIKHEAKPPYQLALDTADTTQAHFVELGVSLPHNGGGTCSFWYRPVDLDQLYREWLVEEENRLGKMALAEYRAKERENKVELQILVEAGPGEVAPPVKMAIRDAAGKAFRGVVTLTERVFVTPGPVKVIMQNGTKAQAVLVVDGQEYGHTNGTFQVPTSANAMLKVTILKGGAD